MICESGIAKGEAPADGRPETGDGGGQMICESGIANGEAEDGRRGTGERLRKNAAWERRTK